MKCSLHDEECQGHEPVHQGQEESGSCDGEEHLLTECGRSFKIGDITNIMFGGLSSRFWTLRKHINLMPKQELDNLPFYSWNCLTICSKLRDVDLVIQDESDMQLIIKFLIYKLRTVDGMRGSSTELLNKMN